MTNKELAGRIETAKFLGSTAQYWQSIEHYYHDEGLSNLIADLPAWKDSKPIIEAWQAAYDEAERNTIKPEN